MTNRKYDNIKVLRIIACMGVVATHICRYIQMPTTIRKICEWGQYGVYMFFLISGFVSFRYLSCKNEIITYWKRRIVRIVPIYYAVILCYFFIYQIIDVGQNVPIDETGIRWWRYLTFTNYCIPGPDFWRNLGGVWTVSFFLLFYLLVPLFQKIIRSYKMSLFITVIFLAVKVIWPSQLIEWFAPFWGLFYFMVGVTANVAIKEKKERSYITLLSIFSIFLMSIDHFDPILFIIVFCILLLSTLEWNIPSKYRAIVDLMDEYSYTIYLGHCLALQILGLNDLPKNGCLYVLIFAVVTWIICLILHNIIEKPISNVIRMKKEKANS